VSWSVHCELLTWQTDQAARAEKTTQRQQQEHPYGGNYRAEHRRNGCVAKIFKLIKNDRVVAAKTNSSKESEYVFYSFYLCSIVEYILF